MGSQQLLLVGLTVILVGIAVAMGVMIYDDSMTSANRDAVVNDLAYIAGKAQAFCYKPESLGGGGGGFIGASGGLGVNGMSKLVKVPSNATTWSTPNGTYTIESASDSFIILSGKGIATGGDGTLPVEIQMEVRKSRTITSQIN